MVSDELCGARQTGFVFMRSLLVHSFLLALLPLSVLALSIPFTARSTHLHLPRQSSGVVPVGNTQNAFYYSNITLGGRQISVMLDTGRCASSSPPSPVLDASTARIYG